MIQDVGQWNVQARLECNDTGCVGQWNVQARLDVRMSGVVWHG